MPNYLCHACICCYDSIDLDNLKVGCVASGECLCLSEEYCCAIGEKPFGVGMTTEDGDICKIGLYICQYGLKSPTTLCAGAQQFLCLKGAGAFPFDEKYVKEPTCAFCFLACVPEGGCAVEAPACNALDR
mmetsp:Transcript_18980/g.23348  ORF Transcript_18980/g.23348 Transcript_18980/m.23348 type:complete len:130 (-) Transcript_18980:196-585(-)